ncbi:hypothetical protein FQR65_LT03838 [Abscondita terminalis]|nr:hypothetical protein FQR65_LT03838 [Abscondita terminalis]
MIWLFVNIVAKKTAETVFWYLECQHEATNGQFHQRNLNLKTIAANNRIYVFKHYLSSSSAGGTGIEHILIVCLLQLADTRRSESQQSQNQNHDSRSISSPSSSTTLTRSSTQVSLVERNISTPESIGRPQRCKKPRRKRDLGDGGDKAEQILNIVSKKLNNPEDEFDIIGKNVAIKLRQLPSQSQLFAEKLINDVLFKARLGQINEYTTVMSHPPTYQTSMSPNLQSSFSKNLAPLVEPSHALWKHGLQTYQNSNYYDYSQLP